MFNIEPKMSVFSKMRERITSTNISKNTIKLIVCWIKVAYFKLLKYKEIYQNDINNNFFPKKSFKGHL